MSRSGTSLFASSLLVIACVCSGACSSDESPAKVGRRADAVEDGLGPWLDTPNFDSFNLHAIIDGSVAGKPNLYDNMWGDCHPGGGTCTLPAGVSSWSEVFRNPTPAESDTLKKAIQAIVSRIVSGDFTAGYGLSDPLVTALSTINYQAELHYDSFMDRMLIVVVQKPATTGHHDYRDDSDPTVANRGRNWGTFVFNETPSNWTVIQAPHTRFDQGTELMAVDAFEKGDCFALMVAGTNRYAIDHPTTATPYAQADVAHASTVYGSTGGAGEGNAFNLVQRAILDAGAADVTMNIIQLHGYDEVEHGYAADAVISSSVFATAGDSSTAQIRTFASGRIRAAVEAAYPGDQSPLAVPTPSKEFKAQTGNFLFEGSRNLQAYDASNSNAAYHPPFPVLFTHVEMPQCVRIKGYSGTNCSYRTDDDRFQMSRTLAYAADDAMAEIEYPLLPSKDALGVTACGPSPLPALGWDSDVPPANADGSPETGTDGLPRMFTLQGIAHNAPLTFVGFHLDSPRITGVPKCYQTAAGRWAGNQRRVALKRLGLRAAPLWFGPVKTSGTCAASPSSDLTVDIDPPTAGVNDGATEAQNAYRQLLTEGFGSGTTLFLDVEQYAALDSATFPRVRTWISDWFNWFTTPGNNAADFGLGVYCSPSNCKDISLLSHVPSTTGYWVYDGRCTTGTSNSPGCVVDRWISPLWPSTHATITGSTTLKAWIWQYAQNPNSDSITGCIGYGGAGPSYTCRTPSYGDYATYSDFADLDSLETNCPHDGAPAASHSPIGEYTLRFPESTAYTNAENTIRTLVTNTQPTQSDFDAAASTVDVDSLTMRGWRQLYRAGAARMVGARLFTSTGAATLPNGGFENGVARWTTAGSVASTTSGLSGSAAQVGATVAVQPQTSTLARDFLAPANAGVLTLSYKLVCPDTVTFDQLWITLQDVDANSTYTVLGNTCTNTGAWSTIRYSLANLAGHHLILRFNNHDDGYSADPTFTLIDDVALEAATNGSFEAGSLTGWTTTGSASISQSGYAGFYAARVGSTNPTNTSTIAQTFLVPASAGTLSFDYRLTCPDNIIYDHFGVTLTDTLTQTTYTVLANTCTNSGAWDHVTYSLGPFAGHDVTLTFTNLDDAFQGDATYTDLDNIVVLY